MGKEYLTGVTVSSRAWPSAVAAMPGRARFKPSCLRAPVPHRWPRLRWSRRVDSAQGPLVEWDPAQGQGGAEAASGVGSGPAGACRSRDGQPEARPASPEVPAAAVRVRPLLPARTRGEDAQGWRLLKHLCGGKEKRVGFFLLLCGSVFPPVTAS